MEKVHPDAVIHCAAWTAVDAAEEPENIAKSVPSMSTALALLPKFVKSLGLRCSISVPIMFLMAKEPLHGTLTVKNMIRSMCMARVSLTENSRYLPCW